MVEAKALTVKYIKLERNPADIMTKNVKEVIHNAHSPNVFSRLLVSPISSEPIIIKTLSGMLVQGGCQECPMNTYAMVSSIHVGLLDDTEFMSCTTGHTFTDFCRVLRAADNCTGQSCPSTNRNAGINYILWEHNTGIGLYDKTKNGVTTVTHGPLA